MPTFAQLDDLERLWFLSLSIADLMQAELACAQAVTYMRMRGADPHVYDCLHDAAITRYCRPFSPSMLPTANRGRTCLEDADIFGDRVPPEHSQAKRMRNQVVAHSDMTVKDVRVTRLADDANGVTQWTSDWSRDRWEPHS